jgi:UDP-2,3-diacylglucosamine hydrolase
VEFAAALRGLDPERCHLLVLLGDLFHVWVGDRRYETAEIGRVVPELDAARARGIRVCYVEGNRDFFLDDSPYASCFDAIGPELAFEQAGVRYLVVHGDGLNAGDWKYLFWRGLSKNPVSRFVCRRVPAGLAGRFVNGMDRRLADTNFEHKSAVPEPALRSYGEKRLAEGHDVVLMGHYHEPCSIRVQGGEVRVLDAWFHHRRFEWLS